MCGFGDEGGDFFDFFLRQFAAEGRASSAAHALLRARHEYRASRLTEHDAGDGKAGAQSAYALRLELIAAEREFIYRQLQEGKITDESRRRIERELDLEEASIACKREGGQEPPL